MKIKYCHTLLTAAVICLLASFSAAHIHASSLPVGQWEVHTAFAVPQQKVIETEHIVYYTSGGSLFSYDKKNNENFSYNSGNKLTDDNITDIFYNHTRHYLFIAYESGNIDLLYDDGHLVNMSDIKDSSITPPLTINSVAFDGDDIYVATAFGLVHFNEPRHEVVRSANFGTSFSAVTLLGDRIVVHADDKIRYIPRSANISSFDNFRPIADSRPPVELMAIDDSRMILRFDDPGVYLCLRTIDFDAETSHVVTVLTSLHNDYSYTTRTPDGTIYFAADNCLYTLDPSRDYAERLVASLPDELKDSRIGTYSGPRSLWSLNKQGIAHYSLGEAGSLTVNMDRFLPETLSVKKVCYFFPDKASRYLYMQNVGSTSYRFNIKGSLERAGRDKAQTASRIDLLSGDIKDLTLFPVDTRYNSHASPIDKYATACTSMTPDPDDPDTYYLSTTYDGVFKVTDGHLVGRYDNLNAPFVKIDERYISYGVSIDRGGNLWVSTLSDGTSAPVIILPADKRKLDPSQVKASDWITLDLAPIGFTGGQDAIYLHCSKSDMIFIIDGNQNWIMLAYDTRGTFNDFSDDKVYLWKKFTDQDGKILENTRSSAICEDLNGRVWLGTYIGVIEIANPSKATDPSMTVTHVKVPRNDGSNLADYLIGTDLIHGIAVDAANRKWIATLSSGLYLVTPSGNEIIERFTTENSPLLSNMVNAVYTDPHSATLYVGTMNGLYTYTTDATPAMPDYSDIIAYPNPVRPEYSGHIYIKGLMDNSLVKITDSAGHVVCQGRSEGGLFTWSGANSSGVRVPTGIYYVMVSQSSDGSSGGAVTKIMIVN